MTRLLHGPNVRLHGVIHDAKTRIGRTACGLRFVLYASASKGWAIVKAAETTEPVDCMTCLVRTDT